MSDALLVFPLSSSHPKLEVPDPKFRSLSWKYKEPGNCTSLDFTLVLIGSCYSHSRDWVPGTLPWAPSVVVWSHGLNQKSWLFILLLWSPVLPAPSWCCHVLAAGKDNDLSVQAAGSRHCTNGLNCKLSCWFLSYSASTSPSEFN